MSNILYHRHSRRRRRRSHHHQFLLLTRAEEVSVDVVSTATARSITFVCTGHSAPVAAVRAHYNSHRPLHSFSLVHSRRLCKLSR